MCISTPRCKDPTHSKACCVVETWWVPSSEALVLATPQRASLKIAVPGLYSEII